MEKLIRQIIREELRGKHSPRDEIGGIELAEKITGLKTDTINKKVSRKEIPFRQEVKRGRVRFSRNDLIRWTAENKR